jgi:rRNA-processing protein FCF1
MKYVLLDTNFILSCIRKKIDFADEIKFLGLKIVVPTEVKQELKNLVEKSQKKFQEESKIALRILEKNKFEEISLGIKNVDNGIVNFANEHNDYIVATLDKEMQSKLKNHKLIIKGNKQIEII